MITNVRFTNLGELVVLQVLDTGPRTFMGHDTDWRNAAVTDLLEVSTYFNTQMGERVRQLEDRVDNLTNKLWGED